MNRTLLACLALGLALPAPPATGQTGLSFQPLTPCRVIDTRNAVGPYGGPKLQPGAVRTFTIPPNCGVPVDQLVLSVNATVTNPDGPGHIVLFPGGGPVPPSSNQNFAAGQTRAVQALVALAGDGSLGVRATGAPVDFILDVNGYFIPTPATGDVTLDPVPNQTVPTNTTLSLRLSGHSTNALSTLTYSLVAGPAGASVSPLGVFAYTPSPSQLGGQLVTVQVRDGGGHSAQRTFQVTVVDHDHPPVLGPLSDDVTTVGTGYTKLLTATDPDPGDTLTFTLLSGPAGMTLAGSTLSWTPTVAQLGNWPVEVKVTDRAGFSDNGLFHVGLRFLTAADDAYTVHLNETLTVPAPGVLANDVDPLGLPLSATKVSDPDKGTLNSFNANGGFVYQAPATLAEPPFAPTLKLHLDQFVIGGTFQDAPLVADVDGDGKPEIIVLSGPGGFGIAAIRGTDGSVLWSRPVFDPPNTDCTMGVLTGGGLRHLAVGDIDDSGHVSIVFPTSCGRDNQPSGITGTVAARYAALNGADGTLKWLSPPIGDKRDANGNPWPWAAGTSPTLARLRFGETPSILVAQDGGISFFAGKPVCDEVVPGWPNATNCRAVFALDGTDGRVRQKMAAPFPSAFAHDLSLYSNGTQAPIAADLDGDGAVELVYGGAVFRNDGSILGNDASNLANCCSVSYWTGLGNFDDTPDIEIVRMDGGGFSTLNRLGVFKADGTLVWSVPIASAGYVGIPAVADVDGSGRPAVVFNSGPILCAVDYRGSYKWCHDTSPNGISSGAGVQVYDLDGDGISEVIVPIQGEKLLFLDGATGNVRYTLDMSAVPPTGPRYTEETGGPVVADVDGSGHASIVLKWTGLSRLSVVAPAVNSWRPARKIFNQESYQHGNVNDDGTLPRAFVNNFANPATNVFRNQGQILTPVPPLEKQTTTFTYAASDGTLTSAPGNVTITILPPNRPPRFTSRPPTRYVPPDFAFTYTAQAVDPDPGDTITYGIKAATGTYAGTPGVCSIGSTSGVLTCNNLVQDDQIIAITATDSQGAVAYQTIQLHPSAGPATVPNVVGQTQAAATTTLTAAGFGVGDITRIDNPAPKDQVVQQTPGGGTQALLGSLVDLVLSNGPAAPPPPPGPPPNLGNLVRIIVTPASTLQITGGSVPFKATSVNDDGTGADITAFVAWSSTVAGVATVNAAGIAQAVGAGTTTIRATSGGLSGQATLGVVARNNGDSVPPVAAITQPSSGGTVTGLTQVTGSATDPGFVRYELSLAASGDSTYTPFGQGTSAVTSGALGTLDPTLLLNGAYTLRLTVFDAGGNTTTADVPIVVDGAQKVGSFTVAYTDATLPLAGMPIQLTRLYDSRDKRSGDFGVGWTLGIRAFRVSSGGPQGTSWQVVQQGQVYALVPGRDHFVTVAAPSGRAETFDLALTPTSSFLVPFQTLQATFVPRPGNLGTLQTLDNVNILVTDPQPGPITLLDDTTLNTFDPDRFLYTSLDGTRYVVTRSKGVESVTDRNGNQITITAFGISHSSGPAIVFSRDGAGRITGITDPRGKTQSYTYATGGDLTSHTDATGAISRYFYDARHGLVRAEDPLGHAGVRTEYDDQGRLLSVTDATGRTITYTHDLPGRLEQVEDSLGRLTVLGYDDRGNVLSRVDPLGQTSTTTYDGLDNETSHLDPDLRKTNTAYDGALPTSFVRDPQGLALTTTFTYDAAKYPTSLVSPGGSASVTYDANQNVTGGTTPFAGPVTSVNGGLGLPTQITDALGTTRTLTRDAQGRVTREEVRDTANALLQRTDSTYDANGNTLTETFYRTIGGVLTPLTTTYAYDAAGRLTTVTDPAAGVTTTEYDAAGRVTAVVDALGRRTRYGYDTADRVVLTTFADHTTTTRTYDEAGNLATTTDQAGRTTTYEYDALDRLVKTTAPDGTATQTVYTPAGLVAATIDERGGRTDYVQDSAARVTTVVYPTVPNGTSGQTARPTVVAALDGAGRPTSVTDPNGRQTSYQYDAGGRPTQVIYADGSSITQTFDVLGRRTSATNEEGQTTTFTYDALGRLVAVHGLAGDATYAYDEAGNLTSRTDALGRITTIEYDVLGRPVKETYPLGGTEVLSYDAVGNLVSLTDPKGQTTSFTYDVLNRLVKRTFSDATTETLAYTADGRRASVVDARGTTIWSYDPLGRVTAVSHPTGETISYGRDPGGNLLSLASPSATQTYGYDALGRMRDVTGPEGQSRYFYDLAGNRVRLAAANGAVSDVVYDLRDRPSQITHRAPDTTLLASFTNVFSPAGRRTQVTELDGSKEQYTFDGRGRLATETRTGVGPYTISHAYDGVGNRTQTTENGVPTSFSYDAGDRLLGDGSATYAYDANGNLIKRTIGAAVTQYGYDPRDRLTSISDAGGTTQHTYDADGDRVKTVSPSGTTRTLVDSENGTGFSQVLEERDGAGALAARYTLGTDLLAMARGGLTVFHHRDGLGSVRLLTNGAGAGLDRYQFDGYGRTKSATGTTVNPYLFAGERLDSGPGLYQLRARYYSPSLGRFLSRDPADGRLASPSSLHPYLYANGDPIDYRDPSGRESLLALSLALAINTAIENAFEISKDVVEGCAAIGKLNVIGQTVMWGSLAATAVAQYQLLGPGKSSIAAFGTNPAAFKSDDIESVQLRLEFPLAFKVAVAKKDKTQVDFSLDRNDFIAGVGVNKDVKIRPCGVPIGSLALKFRAKADVGKSLGLLGTVTAELNALGLFRFEYPLLEAGFSAKFKKVFGVTFLGFDVFGLKAAP